MEKENIKYNQRYSESIQFHQVTSEKFDRIKEEKDNKTILPIKIVFVGNSNISIKIILTLI